jgi:hypothetical protein
MAGRKTLPYPGLATKPAACDTQRKETGMHSRLTPPPTGDLLKRACPGALILTLLAAVASAGSPVQVHMPGADGWISLFDGNSLQGWHVAARPEDLGRDFWAVRDGAITCDSRGHPDHNYVWLIHESEFGDFELKLKVRGYRESPGNSGVQVRSRYDYAAHWLDGPQIDVHPPAPWRTGLIYDETRETKRWIFPSLKDWQIDDSYAPPGWVWKYSNDGDGWNDLFLECNGTDITTTLNGVPAASLKGSGILDDEAHRKHDVGLRGMVALQLHMRDELFIQYKDIYIRPAR